VVRRALILAILLAASCRARPGPPAAAIQLRDDAGAPVRLAAPAARIISLVPAATELIFALGAGPALVGRTRWCDYPPEAARVSSVGDGMMPNVEAIAALSPDLVVMYQSPSNGPAVARLGDLGIPTAQLALNLHRDFDRAARLLARATGRDALGDSLVAAVAAGLEAATVHPTVRPSVFILAWNDPPMTIGGGSFLSEILVRAGARNAFGDSERPSFNVSIEAVVARDPDLILVTGEGDPKFLGRPEWQSVRAVRERRLVRVNGSMFNRPSPRIAEAVGTLAAALGAAPR